MGLADQKVEQAVITDQTVFNTGQAATRLALFREDGTPILAGLIGQYMMPPQADSVAADLPTLVADFNSLLAKLRNAGYMGI